MSILINIVESSSEHENEFVKEEVSGLWQAFIGKIQFKRLMQAGMIRGDHDRAQAAYPQLSPFFAEGLPIVFATGAVVMTFPQDGGNRIELSLELGHMVGEYSIHEQFGTVISDPDRELYQFEDIIPKRALQETDIPRVEAVLKYIRSIHDVILDRRIMN